LARIISALTLNARKDSQSKWLQHGSLYNKIDTAAADTILTETRRRRAHDEVRVLGNDVLHDDWRAVTEEEVELAHHYIQRILEDFYDDRPSVNATLVARGRLTAAPPSTSPAPSD